MKAFPVILSVFVAGATGTLAQPTFDCAHATEAAEQAICADKTLTDSDQRMAVLYKEAIDRLAHADAEVLRADQRAWIAERNAAFARDQNQTILKTEMEERNEMLGKTIRATNPYLGRWDNHSGYIVIKDRRGLIVFFNDQRCGDIGQAHFVGNRLVLSAGPEGREAENWSLRITHRPPVLKIEELPPIRRSKNSPKRTCTDGATVAGTYFPGGR